MFNEEWGERGRDQICVFALQRGTANGMRIYEQHMTQKHSIEQEAYQRPASALIRTMHVTATHGIPHSGLLVSQRMCRTVTLTLIAISSSASSSNLHSVPGSRSTTSYLAPSILPDEDSLPSSKNQYAVRQSYLMLAIISQSNRYSSRGCVVAERQQTVNLDGFWAVSPYLHSSRATAFAAQKLCRWGPALSLDGRTPPLRVRQRFSA